MVAQFTLSFLRVICFLIKVCPLSTTIVLSIKTDGGVLWSVFLRKRRGNILSHYLLHECFSSFSFTLFAAIFQLVNFLVRSTTPPPYFFYFLVEIFIIQGSESNKVLKVLPFQRRMWGESLLFVVIPFAFSRYKSFCFKFITSSGGGGWWFASGDLASFRFVPKKQTNINKQSNPSCDLEIICVLKVFQCGTQCCLWV